MLVSAQIPQSQGLTPCFIASLKIQTACMNKNITSTIKAHNGGLVKKSVILFLPLAVQDYKRQGGYGKALHNYKHNLCVKHGDANA